FDALLNATDLVLLDIKNIDPQKHLKVTSQRIDNIISFAQELDRRNIPVWIRHVYVNEELNTDDELYRLGEFIGGLKNIKAVDVLPYHTMGKVKYDNLGIPYPLEGIKDASKDQAQEARRKILQGMKAQRVREKGSQN
ncbi:MAG: pyruvate formate-lyase 1-activating enzyme, partial [Erysipelotrichales bacterium]|nr:pyruvate formate-lyase 1-activating enzyme [Erysipelotrichales bacterium]